MLPQSAKYKDQLIPQTPGSPPLATPLVDLNLQATGSEHDSHEDGNNRQKGSGDGKPKKKINRSASVASGGKRQEQNRRAQQAYREKKQDHLKALEDIAASMTERMHAVYHVLISAVNEIESIARLANLNYATQTLADRIRGTSLEGPLLEIQRNNERLSSVSSWNMTVPTRRLHNDDIRTEDEFSDQASAPQPAYAPAPRLFRSTTAPMPSPSHSRSPISSYVGYFSQEGPPALPDAFLPSQSPETSLVHQPEPSVSALPMPKSPRWTPYIPSTRPRAATHLSQPTSPNVIRSDMQFEWPYPYDPEVQQSSPFPQPGLAP